MMGTRLENGIQNTYKKVPNIFKSVSTIEPDAPLRPTQSNIGYYLSKHSSIKDDGYGTNKRQYSGIGDLKLVDESGDAVSVPRSHHHVLTGLDRYSLQHVSKEALEAEVKANSGLFAKDIHLIGPKLFNLSRTHISQPLPKLAEKQLFPRSIMFELDYTKAVNKKAMLEALKKEREDFEKSVQERKANVLKKGANRIQESVDEDVVKSIPGSPKQKKEIVNTTNEEERTRKECASVCGPCGCVLTRGICPKCHKSGDEKVNEVVREAVEGWKEGEMCEEWPNEKPKYGSPWGDQRKAELLRVGYPFAREAASWLYCKFKPLDQSLLYRPAKKKYPERSFSSLNI